MSGATKPWQAAIDTDKFLFGSKDNPTDTGPSQEQIAAKEAARRERERLQRKKGFSSTVLTQPVGQTTPGTGTTLG